MVVYKELKEFLNVKISLKYGVWGKKRIPLELKNNRNMENKYTGVKRGQEIKLGTFSPDLVYLWIPTVLQNIFHIVSDAYVMGKPGHLRLKKSTCVI